MASMPAETYPPSSSQPVMSSAAPRSRAARLTGALSAAVGAVTGIAPHVLHHIGPLAGAALLTGATGSVLFGVIGFGLMLPMLLRLKRRFRSWLAPAVAVVLFGAMFTVSTLWIGPAIRGDGDQTSPAHDDHDHTGLVTIGGPAWNG